MTSKLDSERRPKEGKGFINNNKSKTKKPRPKQTQRPFLIRRRGGLIKVRASVQTTKRRRTHVCGCRGNGSRGGSGSGGNGILLAQRSNSHGLWSWR